MTFVVCVNSCNAIHNQIDANTIRIRQSAWLSMQNYLDLDFDEATSCNIYVKCYRIDSTLWDTETIDWISHVSIFIYLLLFIECDFIKKNNNMI